jgi:drug/metabolite transporter superfamily protein YnfA
MNPRGVAGIAGTIILALGLAGLLYPDRVMGLLGFAVLNPSSAAAALGEIRAIYGGLFVVMGVYTLLAVVDPFAHRARLRFVGLLWLGAVAGRLVGVSIDGSPGMPGWLSLGFELVIGGALLASSFVKPATYPGRQPQVVPAAGQN